MKKQFFSLLVMICPVFVFGQNIGIDIANPSEKLEVDGSIKSVSNGYGLLHNYNGTTIGTYISSAGGWIGTASNHPFHFFTDDSSPLMTLTTDGYLGIGTQTPSEMLHVNGNVKVSGIISGVSEPVNAQDAAIKAYIDALETKIDLIALSLNITVQQKLDVGLTPKQIYDSDNSLLDSLYGKTYQGGLIAYLNTSTGTGLIAAPADYYLTSDWGCYGTEIGGTSAAIGSGQANSTLIINGCEEFNFAAKICNIYIWDGYYDWFLPSIDELNELYINLYLNGFGGFSSDFYWSSTEWVDSDTHGTGLSYNTGTSSSYHKSNDFNIRPVRAF
jgi:hypothetical protein